MRNALLKYAFPALVSCLFLGSAANAAEVSMWREAEPERLVYMELQDGLVLIELNPLFAPRTVKQFTALVEDGFYDGLPFYRVIEGFVAQGGDGSDLGEHSEIPLLDAEFEIDWPADASWTAVQSPDMFAPQTGFIDGFAAARDPAGGKAWLAHCPGIVAMARNEGPDTSRTDFYIVIGQAPRYLDRNMNVFGRVIHGMDAVQGINRGRPENDGIIRDEAASSRIKRIRMGHQVPETERLTALVPDTSHASFQEVLDQRRDRRQPFFHNKPPRVLDVCQVPVGGRVTR
ncbi:MAG: peptidylprolyl isomerase [Xanthomonadales bacterium]|jgi:peptidylprolyl isomerase|nr:peptidylprolyl isomerase [Xanthomonadales bacterium]